MDSKYRMHMMVLTEVVREIFGYGQRVIKEFTIT